MLTMEIHAVYLRLYNVAMFTESKIQVKKVPRDASPPPPPSNLLDGDGSRCFGVDA